MVPMGFGACGTARTNRKGMPTAYKTTMRKGAAPEFVRQKDLLCTRFYDKKQVVCLTNVFPSGTTQKRVCNF
jgi:hypothetical protein